MGAFAVASDMDYFDDAEAWDHTFDRRNRRKGL